MTAIDEHVTDGHTVSGTPTNLDYQAFGTAADLFMHQRYKTQQSKLAERHPRQSVPTPPKKPTLRRKVIRRRDREKLSNYKRNYVRRETYVLPRHE